uniref:tudor domain-containing 6-like isoform X1 n=1 Tax=Doryrhamphus excisus TaxID=161450 RepID=UPI0025AE3837|nr:tudor domain-containing 6-like isoform X1 [Doryrhamphus excisus]XP_057912003.1 tudor domain-containing 6-like isoform X1 [Doryrhamphus excisus]XP_057912004.1 tudor domain-containing 6-like isoform X1 [Doryrhamphus excisus]XP_057912005.1 tudor domain-containing 6-like isoform X1 [Doryrhamphus excisus]XP_057912006.1 tudor domain-containing 6-like isoform X1 [Doryrhamphus excisus]XP_057912007.1 tudor domain-containing 6-like isoform X1 [Doryrhamphus excisus]XP_057912008.1 tudor domain-contain
MCSIPGLPTPGSEVTVDIKRVNPNPKCGLVELWVSIDVGRKHAYEQMKELIQIPKRMFSGSEGKPGDLCLVCIADKWHRARIVSVQEEARHVFLIDQGRPHITKWDALAWGQSDSFFLPPEIESCVLATIIALEESWPEKAAKFLTSLPGKTMSAVVRHVLMPDRTVLLDIPLISKQMCAFRATRKLPVDECREIVLDYLHPPKAHAPVTCDITQESLNTGFLDKTELYFYPELHSGILETVHVTEVLNTHNVFCRLQIFTKSLNMLYKEIQQYYEEFLDPGEERPKTSGEPCATRGDNGRWHRSLLQQNILNGDELVQVMRVDEGKIEFVPVGCIRPLLRKFLRMPVVTYGFSLNGVEDGGTMDQIEYLKSLLLNKTFAAWLEKHPTHEGAYNVTLYSSNATCMNTCFLEKAQTETSIEPSSALSAEGVDFQNLVNLNVENMEKQTLAITENGQVDDREDAVVTSSPNDQDDPEHPQPVLATNGHFWTSKVKSFHYEDEFVVGSTIKVNVSCIEGPHKFWCQKTENEETLRLLMESLQDQYRSVRPLSLDESACVARNPDNGMWYRARIVTGHHTPEVEVQFFDYGTTQTVPLRDVHPIDPAFLQLDMLAFQCRLHRPKTPTNSAWTDAASTEFQKFVELGKSELKCIVKARASDGDGQLVHVVDLQTSSDSACKLLTQKCVQALPVVSADTYRYSTYDMDVGRKEKVWITSSQTVHHFFCQLSRNSHLFDKVTADVQQVIGKSRCRDGLIRLNDLCLARYTGNEWYRAQVVQMSPNPEVLFVDYGSTLTVNKSDILPLPASASVARSVPVLAVPLGLFGVPADGPEEVNQWFADHAVGTALTISVVSTGDGGKLIVELFDGAVNVNAIVREKIEKAKRQTVTEQVQDCQASKEESTVQDEDLRTEELVCISNLRETLEQRSNGTQDNVALATVLECDPQKTLEDSNVILNNNKEMLPTNQPNDAMTQHCPPEWPEGPEKRFAYKTPNVTPSRSEEAYISCLVGPSYFWCQFANTEDLKAVSTLAQTVGESLQDITAPKSLNPGSPCLALFSGDSQWYRAQVVRNTDNMVCVLFVDFGNESEIDVQDVRAIPRSLMEYAPQAFLCTLDGFDESKGSWEDEVYDDLYNLVVDKPVRVTVLVAKEHSEMALPQHSVQLDCGNTNVNEAMQKYWKAEISTEFETGTIQEATEPNAIVIKENPKAFPYRQPNIPLNKAEVVYASCIVEPHFFWCQFANTTDLCTVVTLAQEGGQADLDPSSFETFRTGTPCLALFPADNQWYRAQILSKEGNGAHVVFIDYGNEADIDAQNVRPLPPSLQEYTPQAFLCTLDGFDDCQGSWEDDVYDDFYNLVVDKPLTVTVSQAKNQPAMSLPHHVVTVECEGLSVNAAMQKYWKATTGEQGSPLHGQTQASMLNITMYKKPNISSKKSEMVYASSLVDPHFFWCQFSNTKDLKNLTRLAQEAGKAELDENFLETLVPGSPCLVLYSVDHHWYRAQVVSRADDSVYVVFIDHGNYSGVDVKNVRPLPLGLLEVAPQAFLCSLSGFEASKCSWDKDACDEFVRLLTDKALKVTVFDAEDNPETALPQYEVQIECEGVSVNAVMGKYRHEKAQLQLSCSDGLPVSLTN